MIHGMRLAVTDRIRNISSNRGVGLASWALLLNLLLFSAHTLTRRLGREEATQAKYAIFSSSMQEIRFICGPFDSKQHVIFNEPLSSEISAPCGH